MRCGTCSSEIPVNAQFCHICGDSVSDRVLRGVGARMRNPALLPTQARIAFALAGMLLLAGLGYFAYMTRGRIETRTASNFVESVTHATASVPSAANIYDRLTKKEHRVPLDNRAMTVNQLGYSFFQLDVPPKASSVELQGKFVTSGAGGNTIEAFVFSESDYEKWLEKRAANPFYSSGRVSMGTIDASLPSGSGTYYLVFNNKFSGMSPKLVRLDAALNYYQ